jgi:hypothetical protein
MRAYADKVEQATVNANADADPEGLAAWILLGIVLPAVWDTVDAAAPAAAVPAAGSGAKSLKLGAAVTAVHASERWKRGVRKVVMGLRLSASRRTKKRMERKWLLAKQAAKLTGGAGAASTLAVDSSAPRGAVGGAADAGTGKAAFDATSTSDLTRRQTLRRDLRIRYWILQFFDLVADERGLVTVDSYIRLNMALYKLLVEPFDAASARSSAMKDWDHDRRGRPALDQNLFFDSVFELVQNWTCGEDADEYEYFLAYVLSKITMPVQKAEATDAADADAAAQDGAADDEPKVTRVIRDAEEIDYSSDHGGGDAGEGEGLTRRGVAGEDDGDEDDDDDDVIVFEQRTYDDDDDGIDDGESGDAGSGNGDAGSGSGDAGSGAGTPLGGEEGQVAGSLATGEAGDASAASSSSSSSASASASADDPSADTDAATSHGQSDSNPAAESGQSGGDSSDAAAAEAGADAENSQAIADAKSQAGDAGAKSQAGPESQAGAGADADGTTADADGNTADADGNTADADGNTAEPALVGADEEPPAPVFPPPRMIAKHPVVRRVVLELVTDGTFRTIVHVEGSNFWTGKARVIFNGTECTEVTVRGDSRVSAVFDHRRGAGTGKPAGASTDPVKLPPRSSVTLILDGQQAPVYQAPVAYVNRPVIQNVQLVPGVYRALLITGTGFLTGYSSNNASTSGSDIGEGAGQGAGGDAAAATPQVAASTTPLKCTTYVCIDGRPMPTEPRPPPKDNTLSAHGALRRMPDPRQLQGSSILAAPSPADADGDGDGGDSGGGGGGGGGERARHLGTLQGHQPAAAPPPKLERLLVRVPEGALPRDPNTRSAVTVIASGIASDPLLRYVLFFLFLRFLFFCPSEI